MANMCQGLLSFPFRRVPGGFVRLVQARGCCWGAQPGACLAVPGRCGAGRGCPAPPPGEPGVLPGAGRAGCSVGLGAVTPAGCLERGFHAWIAREIQRGLPRTPPGRAVTAATRARGLPGPAPPEARPSHEFLPIPSKIADAPLAAAV